MIYLKTFDPTVPMAYFVCVMSICVFTVNPYLHLCALISSAVILLCLKKAKAIKLLCVCAGIIAVMGLSNPVFVHNGFTELFQIADISYTLEALVYGLDSGMSIASLFIWLNVFDTVVSQDDIIAVFGKKTPKTALVISMILGFVPKLQKDYKRLLHAYITSGGSNKKSLRRISKIFIACLAYEAENVIEKSMSMKARGFGLKSRKYAQRRNFRKSDLAALIFSFVICMICFVFIANGKLDYWYYPRLCKNGFDPISVGSYLLLCISPLYFVLKEKLLWRSCPAKM